MHGVAVTGIGIVSPLGCSGEAIATVAAGGIRSEAPLLCDIPLDVVPAAVRARIGRLDRLCRLFLTASFLAADDAGLAVPVEHDEHVGLSFGTGLGCLLTNAEYYDKILEHGSAGASPRLFAYTVSSAAAGEVSIALGIKGPNVTQHMGTAAGLGALGYGFDLIEMGKADVVVAGGADASGAAIAEALEDMGLLKKADDSRPFRDVVPGVRPSEGAVVTVLESAGKKRNGEHPSWVIAGYAAGFEPTLAGRAPLSRGISETMRRALEQSRVGAVDVDVVVSSASGTPNDAAERDSILEVLGRRPIIFAPKAIFGEAFAASSLLGLAPFLQRRTAAAIARAPGCWFSTDGTELDPSETEERIDATALVLVEALCYSGNVVALVLKRQE